MEGEALKRYVQQKTVKTVDGDLLQKVIVYENKVNDFTYLVFVEK
jgi:hypothetical protein